MRRILVTGGGTAGHVNAGISIIDEFKKQFPSGAVLFVGTKRGIESTLITKTKIPIKYINSRGINKESTGVLLYSLFLLPISILQSIFIVLSFNPEVVIGVGGFCSGPVMFASWILGKPVFILEQNTVMGVTNRIAAKFAEKIFTAFPLADYLSAKIMICGNPIRNSITASKRSLAKLEGKTDNDYFNIFIFGGSQGSLAINKCITDAIPLLNQVKNINVYHQTGKIDYERVKEEYKKAIFEHEVFDYTYEMAAIYDKADVVISRAGASTIFELMSARLPSILVPLPTAADNHQYFNARFLKDHGACEMFEQKDLAPDALVNKIRFYIEHKIVLVKMIDKLEKLSKNDKRPEAKIIEVMDKYVW